MTLGLYKTWEAKVEDRQGGGKNAQEYINEYYMKERDAYAKILSEKTQTVSGTVKELAEKYEMEAFEIAAFVDGINTSLEETVDYEALEEDSAVELKIVWEKLYYNMLKARAPWLYQLEEWADVLSEEVRDEITAQFKADTQAVSNKVGRNDPCPCGSGKKYKKCCGRNED